MSVCDVVLTKRAIGGNDIRGKRKGRHTAVGRSIQNTIRVTVKGVIIKEERHHVRQSTHTGRNVPFKKVVSKIEIQNTLHVANGRWDLMYQ